MDELICIFTDREIGMLAYALSCGMSEVNRCIEAYKNLDADRDLFEDNLEYKALAARLGISVNQLFVRAVERYIEDNIGELDDRAAIPEESDK